MTQTRKVRWLIAHQPINLFLRTANAFKEKIAELTNGKFDVEIFTATQYAEQYGTMHRDRGGKGTDPMSSMDDGDLEMSQLHITELGKHHNPDFFALELPFLFRDHDHASRVLEGPIGKKMLADLVDTSPAKGLAFTYSGGFRCIVSENKINTIKELCGVTFATTANPVAVDIVESIGCIPKTFDLGDFYKIGRGQEGYEASALETTIPRYLAQFSDSNKKYMLNTKHNLFLTSIIIQTKFWESLTDDEQFAFQTASLYASRLERKWSVQEAEEFAAKADHTDIGVTYTELPAEETTKFKHATKAVYNKYQNFFYPGLINGIIES
jgi:TRAP-type C4-dicarboxylate transport system substrate-binding protein